MIGDRWRKVRSGIKSGVKFEFFIAESGDIQGIPLDFVVACASGKRLAVEFDSSTDGRVTVFRGSKVDFIIDSSLLLQLSLRPATQIETHGESH